jgi:hypothetical protein
MAFVARQSEHGISDLREQGLLWGDYTLDQHCPVKFLQINQAMKKL